MYIEVSARLAGDDGDSLDLFERSVKATKAAGGIRHPNGDAGRPPIRDVQDTRDWRGFARMSRRSLTRAEPILRKHGVRPALENHKDWRIGELLSILNRIDSKWVGVTVDTGNNMSLLEDSLETARAFAPYATAVHLKDMGVEAYEDGFLLAEVPLGEGCPDLDAVADAIRTVRPKVRFTLEMITRDTLKIPCLRNEYWTTMGHVPGRDLAAALRNVRNHAKPLQRIGQRPLDERLRIEEDNNIACLEYGKRHLGL